MKESGLKEYRLKQSKHKVFFFPHYVSFSELFIMYVQRLYYQPMIQISKTIFVQIHSESLCMKQTRKKRNIEMQTRAYLGIECICYRFCLYKNNTQRKADQQPK